MANKKYIDEDDDDDVEDFKENPSKSYKNELFIKEDLDTAPSTSSQIPSSKSSQHINSNALPRVKFLSDYELNSKLLDDKHQKEPLLSDKTVIDMPERWVDENGRLILKKDDLKSSTSDTIEKAPSPSQKPSKPFRVHYYKNSKSLELIFNLGGDQSSKENGCFSQLRYFSFYQALLAELIGTYLLVLYVCSFGLPKAADSEHASLTGSLGSGFLVATLVWTLANVSGANLNPAVSVALLITGETNLVRALLYIPCQLLGSTLAVLTLKELNASESDFMKAASADLVVNKSETKLAPMQIGLTTLNSNVTSLQGFCVECIITFILVITIFACIDRKRKDLGGSFPLQIGFAIMVGALFGGKFTGGSMNPARSFGPALVENYWADHWVYWTGPIAGAVIAAFIYKTLIFKPKISKA